MILEAFGGITSLFTLHPAPRATGEGGARAMARARAPPDRSQNREREPPSYGAGSSTSAKSFFVHHTQQLAAAAQVGVAKGILGDPEEDHRDEDAPYQGRA